MMKSGLVFIFAFFTMISAAFGQAEEPRFVEVSGTSKLLADIDSATWRFRIRAVADTLAESAASLKEANTALEERFAEIGFAENEGLRLSSLRSGRNYVEENRQRVHRGYFAEREMKFLAPNLDKRMEIEHALFMDDRIEISRVDLATSDHERLKREALKVAMQAAKEKAELMVGELGGKLGPLLWVREGSHIASPMRL
ncbi:MAG: SIMPL domain-containing protein, partial [Verrucomicrobiota bacterium]